MPRTHIKVCTCMCVPHWRQTVEATDWNKFQFQLCYTDFALKKNPWNILLKICMMFTVSLVIVRH